MASTPTNQFPCEFGACVLLHRRGNDVRCRNMRSRLRVKNYNIKIYNKKMIIKNNGSVREHARLCLRIK